MAQANIATAVVELSSIALAPAAIMRRHIANTTVISDISVKTRNLNDLDALEERVRALLNAG